MGRKKTVKVVRTPAGNVSKKTFASGRQEYKFLPVPPELRDIVRPNSGGQAQAHRVIAAKKIKSFLKSHPGVSSHDVVVMHKNNKKADNRVSNLKVGLRSKNTADSNRSRKSKRK